MKISKGFIVNEGRKGMAEFIGTFLLVFFGAGAIIIDGISGGALGHLGIAVAFGLVVLAVIYALGEISGAHLNPAVSWAFFLSGRFPWTSAVLYTIAQMLAAAAASYTLALLFPQTSITGMTQPAYDSGSAFAMEFILSFTLMFVIIHVATGSKEQGLMAGLAIGLTVLLCALVGGPVTGASMNPARSFGPALAAGDFSNFWIYILGPLSGMATSILAWKIIRPSPQKISVIK